MQSPHLRHEKSPESGRRRETRSGARRAPVIGLLGGVGSGKSAVARLFGALGARVIDADRIAHAVLQSPRVRAAVRRRWGPGVFRKNGRVCRTTLGRRVFADPAELRRLTALVHPGVRTEIRARLRRWGRDARPIVLDVPLLLESPLRRHCTALVFVDAPAAVRDRRAARDRGWPAGELARRERLQVPVSRKRRLADAVIDNGGALRQTRRQVRRLYDQLRASHGRQP